MAKLLLLIVGVAALAVAHGASTRPQQQQQQLQRLIAEEQSKCASGQDSMACIKERAMRFVDTVMSKDSFQLSNFEVHSNGQAVTPVSEARANTADGFLETMENYIKGHDVSMNLPGADAKITVSARNLANDEMSLNLQLTNNDAADGDDDDTEIEARGKKGNIFRKGKKKHLRKLVMPIMVLILLKAITVIPMAIGILKIKAFNALALGFFSFLVSVGLAIFQLCKKIAHDHHHTAHITAHGPWDGRSFGAVPVPVVEQPQQMAQNLAYQAYA